MPSDPRDPTTWEPEMKASHDRWIAAGRPNMLDFIAHDVFDKVNYIDMIDSIRAEREALIEDSKTRHPSTWEG